MAVVPDDNEDDDLGRNSEEEDPQPPRSQTPPTPPVHAQPSPSASLNPFYTNYTNYEKMERLIAGGLYSMVAAFLYCIIGLAVSTVLMLLADRGSRSDGGSNHSISKY